MYLLDTNVVSALRRPDRHPEATAWLAAHVDAGFYLSVITVMELERGVHLQRRTNPQYAQTLEQWLAETLLEFAQRILPVTVTVANRWGRLGAMLGNTNIDLAIAATAHEHGLIVATRNVSYFAPTGVKTVDPFAGET